MHTAWHLIRLLTWRPLRRDPARAIVAILGVALGVAVALAIRLANDGVLESFRTGLEHAAGRTQLEVSAGETGFDERLLPTIAGTPGVSQASPVLQALVPVAGGGGEHLLVLGVDLLGDIAVRTYRGPAPEMGEPLRLLTDPDALLLTARYARSRGIAVGGRLRLQTPAGPRAFTVRGLLADEGLARTLEGRVAVLDIAAAQVHFHKLGRLDRVDLLLTPGADPARVAADLRRRLPAAVVVERPAARSARVEQMLGSFQLNLLVLSLIALFVGAFLVYNTMAVSVVRQRRKFGILRGLGVSRLGILRIAIGEGALLGLAGSLLGAGLGILLARWSLEAVSLTVSSLYAFIAPGRPAASTATLGLAVLLGLGMTLLASIVPALEATRAPAREALAPAALERRHRTWRVAALGALLLAATLGLARLGPVSGRPLFGYAASFSLLLGTILLCPLALRAFQGGLAAALRDSRALWLRMAAGNLGRSLRRNGVAVAAMAMGLAMLVGVSTMIASFRSTVEVWIAQSIRGDLYLSPAGRFVKGVDARLPADLLPRVRGVPGVADADGFRTVRLPDGRGGQFLLGAGDFDLLARRGRLLFRRGESSRILAEAAARGEAIVSETFAERYEIWEGGEVELSPPGRTVRLRVGGVYHDYTTEGGLVLLDRRLFQALWADPWLSSIVVYLAPGADPEPVRQAIRRATGRDDLWLLSNRELRQRILEIFDQTFAITYALQAIALLVAALGVFTALAASVLERTREIGILRSLGITRIGLARTILAEAGLLGILANLLGLLAGLGLSLILIHVINKQSFGWTIRFAFPGWLIVRYAVLSLAVSLLAGLLPAWRAARLTIAEAVRYE
jgi:putative ABC transport system permease protein